MLFGFEPNMNQRVDIMYTCAYMCCLYVVTIQVEKRQSALKQ